MADMKINFSTYSEAARAYDILKSQNINARIVRTPASLKHSCGYSLKISEADYGTAGRIISGGSQNHERINRSARPQNSQHPQHQQHTQHKQYPPYPPYPPNNINY